MNRTPINRHSTRYEKAKIGGANKAKPAFLGAGSEIKQKRFYMPPERSQRIRG